VKTTLMMSVGEFCHEVKTNRVFGKLEQAFLECMGHMPGPAERDSWTGSLPRLSGVIELAKIPTNVLIGLEVQVPYYSQRVDAVLYGYDINDVAVVVLIELKQWSEGEATEDGRLNIRTRNGIVPMVHPSAQVDGYRRYLTNFVLAFHTEPRVNIACCVYAHNYPQRAGALFNSLHSEIIDQAPVFCATDAEPLADFISVRVAKGRGAEVFDIIQRGGLAPSRLLIDSATSLIHQQSLFTLLDDQIPARTSIIDALRRAVRNKSKSIILIEGGPGTGKSVIALDALGYSLQKKLCAFFVSGSAAFTHGVRRLLGADLAALVRFTDFFWDHEENSVDVLIVDEGHRVRERSIPRVSAERRPTISQLEELVHAAKVTVLFMDTNQIIEPNECGDPEQVAALAQRLSIKFVRHRLRSQFRCDGSDGYLRWVDDLFEMSDGQERRLLQSPEIFDFDVLETPDEVLKWVQNKNASEPNSARLTAGWCWAWSDPQPDGSLVNDINIGDFEFPWELKNGKKGHAGIPEAKYWAVDPAGANQAGTIYSVQGFEFRHVGVLMGEDLVVRDNRWVARPAANFRNSIRTKSPEVASIYLRRIYRGLFTRPLRSVRACSVDAETRSFLRSRVLRGNPQ
jgi:hypothetical protein